MRSPVLLVLAALFASHFAAPTAHAGPEVQPGLAYTTARLNLRVGPGLGYGIIRVLPHHATVEVTGAASAGYYPVSYQSSEGWAAAAYLRAARRASTTSPLNLRGAPGLEAPILAVMPLGAEVRVTGAASEGFSPVLFNYGLMTVDSIYPTARDRLNYPEHEREGLAPWKVGEIYIYGAAEPDTWVDISATIDRKRIRAPFSGVHR